MYIYKDDMLKLCHEMLGNTEEKIKRTTDQLISFHEDSDWAMVIKLHAALEAMVTQVIISHINQEALRPIIERLALSDNQSGKGRIAVSLELITSSQFAFIRKFSELRNSFVHRVENIDINLKDHFSTMHREQKKAWRTAIAWTSRQGEPQSTLAEVLDANPKVGLLISVLILICLMAVDEEMHIAKRRAGPLAESTMQELLRELQDNPSEE